MPCFAACRFVLGVAANVKQPAVHFRMQRLHAAIEHFGETRELADLHDGNARFLQRARRAARRNDLHAHAVQLAGEFDESRLVRNADQCPLNLAHEAGRLAEERALVQSNFNWGDSVRNSFQPWSVLRKNRRNRSENNWVSPAPPFGFTTTFATNTACAF